VEGDKGFLARLGFHVFKDFLFVVDEEVAFDVCGFGDFRHADTRDKVDG